ncbi:2Fe-2S iron-sulfur cluster-binding protein [Algihabitans albus]|uniref:2Fe-2S iron-sulfur cluster-binding protein n=1 Tax=Algihabitans albus TaxID=2164067 RepID=UPI000E5CF064|nr:pyridoxamine 5'-phosphate oxidase family protein [Algihabitans albus]
MTGPVAPFHDGEIAVQVRAGVADDVKAAVRAGFIRDRMPDQHRRFFERLPFVTLGLLDRDGRAWAVPVWGSPPFLQSPDPKSLRIEARIPFVDALGIDLSAGAKVGLLGVELETRRRNRMNGTIAEVDATGLTLRVDQSFGNCPQYIQKRALAFSEASGATGVARSVTLSSDARALIERADTFFIASRTGELGDDPRSGVDASHRGGRAGFVRVQRDGLLTFPDFAGNRFFNTLGNIEADGRVGLCFPNWTTGDILFVTGRATVNWNEDRIAAFEGAERLVDLQVEDSLFAAKAFAVTGTLIEPWPALALTGTWTEAEANLLRVDGYRKFRIVQKMPESQVVTSFHLEPADGGPVEPYVPGQFLPVRLNGGILRSYTISQAPNGHGYRLSVKREPQGEGSRYLHDKTRIGDVVEVGKPSGDFTLDASGGPVVFLSAGVGITPMIAMLETLAHAAETGQPARPVCFVHAARNGGTQAFRSYLDDLRKKSDWLTTFIGYSDPEPRDKLGETHDTEGRISLAALKGLPPVADSHFYLCGPESFMRSLYRGLRDAGVDRSRIHYEFFGAGSLEDANRGEEETSSAAQPRPERAPVRFEGAGIARDWTPESGSLLDLAEMAGLSPQYNCRKGNCGTCAVKVLSGAVAYDRKPAVAPPAGYELICCGRPKSSDGLVLDI